MTTLTKRFDAPIEEAVDLQFRYMEFLGVGRRQYGRTFITVLVFSSIPCIFFPYQPMDKLKLGIVLFIIFSILLMFNQKSNARKRVRKALIKIKGTDQPIPSEFEISEKGICFRQSGIDSMYTWTVIKTKRETPKTIELIADNSGFMSIPKRIFSESELAEWNASIDAYMSQIRLPSA